MSEPVYEYVKGQGWVVGPRVRSDSTTDKEGRSYHIEIRRPEIGELFERSMLSPENWVSLDEAHPWVQAFAKKGFGVTYNGNNLEGHGANSYVVKVYD